MNDLGGARIAVIGGGVAGLCMGVELTSRGARTVLVDPGGGNASSVAAGMLAPAFEAALDPASHGRLPLLKAARDLWPEVAGGGVRLHRDGALWIELEGAGESASVAAALAREGVRHEVWSSEQVREGAPGVRPSIGGGVFTPDDWRLDVPQACEALVHALKSDGGEVRSGRALSVQARGLETDGDVILADAVVVCPGWESRTLAEAAPESAVLAPIKGELIRFLDGGPREGPVIRTRAGYLVPGEGGLVAGATMEPGAADTRLSPETQDAFVRLAESVYPALKGASFAGAAGVRAATPDGLPLVGRSETGVWLAAGFRRNGWLLAPLAARITADLMAGRDPGPWAHALRPGRFSPA